MNINGDVLRTTTHVKAPRYLSMDSEGHVLAADFLNHRIVLLSQDLEEPRFLVDAHSQVKLWQPSRLCYNEAASQLYVVHAGEFFEKSYFVSIFNTPSLKNTSLPTSPLKMSAPQWQI